MECSGQKRKRGLGEQKKEIPRATIKGTRRNTRPGARGGSSSGLSKIQKVDRPQVFLDFMRDLVSFLKDRDPEALTALEKNFDEFIGFAKQKYS
jgi:hypothetical protein